MSTLEIQPDANAVALHVAEWLTDLAHMKQGRFAVCLSGGSTPKALYSQLAKKPLRDKFPWARAHFFFGDERFVPTDHPDSNYRMAREAMLAGAPVPPENVQPFPTDGTPEDAAIRYAKTLQDFYGAAVFDPARPLFDVVLLGIGEDGHTASLFPGVAALREHEKWTAAVIGAKPEPRLTLTYPALNSTAVAAFVAVGAGKRDMVQRVRAGDGALPASGIKPVGEIIWFLDHASAS